ncbi:MAG: hypothetical protein IH820_03610 [Bacteroidetes bacterium]|nr:hypothetical protein [Bacteroidota bacterium]
MRPAISANHFFEKCLPSRWIAEAAMYSGVTGTTDVYEREGPKVDFTVPPIGWPLVANAALAQRGQKSCQVPYSVDLPHFDPLAACRAVVRCWNGPTPSRQRCTLADDLIDLSFDLTVVGDAGWWIGH